MSTRNLLRHIFRHGPREKVNEDALPLGLKLQATGPTTNTTHETTIYQETQRAAPSTRPPPANTPEPFGLEDIAEEDTRPNTPSVTESETLAWFELEISTFSTRELVHATLYEAKSAASSHLDTINTTLSLLEALEGFSATISELRGEMLEKKQACEEQMATLDAVERSLGRMTFAGETQEREMANEHAG
ncbi:hypothetical protein N0V87_010619 [Didymella glomerata]|jgi:hypothetical protein|uniref:Uncharacterized protein n=1 Tax=Didymella glomerata TaxID=749621 RepID=A0A9W9BUV3_9PLEO|nr:hypothetical protein N0V87_010619 [Didymella glomerata]